MSKLTDTIRRRGSRSKQQGLSLIFALITIVALSLAAVALIRSVDSGTLILGNLGFKQDTQMAAEDGSRAAIKWLASNLGGNTLHTNKGTEGYWASAHTPVDVTGTHHATLGNTRTLIDWDGNDCAGATSGTYAQCRDTVSAGNVALAGTGSGGGVIDAVDVRYVIFRLCSDVGDVNAAGATIHCAKPMKLATSDAAARGVMGYPNAFRFGEPGVPQYFRILVRAKGKRETVTYTETLVHF